MNMADLEIRLSGGASNADANASLGGIMSSHRVISQSATAPSNITGVTIDYVCGNTVGAGTLAFNFTALTLRWTPQGGTIGTAMNVSVNGQYVIADSTGNQQLHVTVVAASLPGSNQNDSITIANVANETFDDISKAENLNGDTEYRCVYITNTHSTDTAYAVTIYLKSDTSGADVLTIGKDLAGVGDGSATGVADTIVNEGTAPDPAVTFSAPATLGAGINLGNFGPGEGAAFWIKRVITGPAAEALSDISSIGVGAYL